VRLANQASLDHLSSELKKTGDAAATAAARVKSVTDGLKEQIRLAGMTPLARDIETNQTKAGVDADSPEGRRIAGLTKELENAKAITSSVSKTASDAISDLTNNLLGQREMFDEINWSYTAYAQTVEQAYARIRAAATTTHEAERQINELNLQMQLQQQQAMWETARTAGQAFATLFPKSKAVAIANAVINTAESVTKTLATYGATPWGIAAAAAAAAAGAVQIATIRSANIGGGGGGRSSLPRVGGSGSTQNQNTDPQKPQKAIHLNIRPGDIFSGAMVQELIQRLNEETANGAVLLATNRKA